MGLKGLESQGKWVNQILGITLCILGFLNITKMIKKNVPVSLPFLGMQIFLYKFTPSKQSIQMGEMSTNWEVIYEIFSIDDVALYIGVEMIPSGSHGKSLSGCFSS